MGPFGSAEGDSGPEPAAGSGAGPAPPILPLPPNATPAYQVRILKYGDCLAVLDPIGDVNGQTAAEGIFFCDTRFVSTLRLTLDGLRPVLLSPVADQSAIASHNDLANPPMPREEGGVVAKETIHIARHHQIGSDAFFETIEVTNFGIETVEFTLGIAIEADFADMFEVRGETRARRGTLLADKIDSTTLELGYRGLDGVVRRLLARFEPASETALETSPERSGLGAGAKRRQRAWKLRLQPQERRALSVTLRFECQGLESVRSSGLSRAEGAEAFQTWRDRRRRRTAAIETDDRGFNDWLRRSREDIEMLITATPSGPIAYAGTPWYSTAFGRDALVTALECLWLDPDLAAGTLRYLAATQATDFDPRADAEPGKILHETRQGEMALLGEVPFRRYYGSADSTPLFVLLAAAYWRRTGDLALIESLWPAIEAALRWMAEYGDRDGDGFIEYGRRAENGLLNQGWKDSLDAVFHADGTIPEPPIAMAEIQGYAYEAWRGGAEMARRLGRDQAADGWDRLADRLRPAFERAFWLEDLGTYAIALDGAKRPCRVRSSNAGQVLLSGLPSQEHAEAVAGTLLQPPSFSGWGIRTLAMGQARFNPMSYHNGTIWPHDNALIAMGFARHNLDGPLLGLLGTMFEVSRAVEQSRLPELFCGFERRPDAGPSAYPVACAPQAWAAASVFGFMGAALRIAIDPEARSVTFTRPAIPDFLHEIRLRNLSVGDAAIDLRLFRDGPRLRSEVLRQTGNILVRLV